MLSQAIATVSAKQRPQGAPYATGPTNHPAASVGLSTQQVMRKQMQVLRPNMQKRREVQHSVMNDASLKEYTALAISEPYVFEMDDRWEGEYESDRAPKLDNYPAESKARRTLGGAKHAVGPQGHRV